MIPTQVSSRSRVEAAPRPSTGARIERVDREVAYLSSGRDIWRTGAPEAEIYCCRKCCLNWVCESSQTPSAGFLAAPARWVTPAVSVPVRLELHGAAMTSTARQRADQPTFATTITGQLDREWAALCERPQSVRHVRSWATRFDPQLASIVQAVETLDEIIAETHARRGPAGERLLRALVSLAPEDQLAGRVVVQRLIPGVLTAASRYGQLCEHDDPISEAMGSLWISIASFDGDRRNGPVAASIISDTMFAAFRRRLRLKSADEQPIEPNVFDEHADTTARCPFVEFAAVVRDARLGGVPTHDLDLLRHLVRAESPQRVAHERQVTPRTIRNHRTRAIERVRDALAA